MRILVSIVLGMSFVFTFTIVSVQALAHTSAESPDPILVNAGDFIGQPVSAIGEQGFSCSTMYSSSDLRALRCILDQVSGTFSEIGVTSSKGIVRDITFTMHKDAIQSGHLIWFWGRPETLRYGRLVYLYWRESNIVAAVPLRHRPYSLSLSVSKVYFLGGSTPVVADNQLTHPASEVTIWPRNDFEPDK